MKIRAAVMYEQGQERSYAKTCPFVIEEVEIDSQKDNEAPVEAQAAGLRHSDSSTIEARCPRPLPAVGDVNPQASSAVSARRSPI